MSAHSLADIPSGHLAHQTGKQFDPKSVMELTNWKKCIGKIKNGGMVAHTCFFMEKSEENV